MTRDLTRAALRALAIATTTMVFGACGDDTKPDSKTNPSTARCTASVLEADLEVDPPAGPGVDSGGKPRLEPGSHYVVSSTYGVPVRGEGGAPVSDRYVQLFGAVQAQLEKQPGLLAISLGTSAACGSGRTLALWRSEEEMYDFVTSPAHVAAMKAASEILQPGYAVTHWDATAGETLTFNEAVQHLKDK